MTTLLESHGFTNATLDWKAWLDTVQLDQATPVQMQVLESSHPKAKVSDYYLLLVHQAEILDQRSTAFNAIMYAPGGLSRAERELASTVVSRVNGCVYCASVHAQRFEQLAKRQDVIAQVFADPATAGTNARERAIVAFSIELTFFEVAISSIGLSCFLLTSTFSYEQSRPSYESRTGAFAKIATGNPKRFAKRAYCLAESSVSNA